jgi:hypothetical protein
MTSIVNESLLCTIEDEWHHGKEGGFGLSDVDVIRQCQVCGQFRHVSWFDVGARGCKQCQADEVVSFEMAKAQVLIEHMAIPETMLSIVREETKPDSITAGQWRMLHMLSMNYDNVAIALATSLPSQDIEKRKQEALHAMFGRQRRADINLGISESEQP